MVKRLLNYTRAFEENYSVCIVDERMTDITEDMNFSNYLPVSSGVTYLRYTTVGKIMIKHNGLLHLS